MFGISFMNSGIAALKSGSLVLSFKGYTQTAGVTQLAGGSLGGTGVITADVQSAGQVVPGGATAGILHIAGTYKQQAAGALRISINGPTAGTGYGELQVSKTATIGGMLSASTASSFIPAHGSTFSVLSAGSVQGRFSILHTLGQSYTVSYQPTAVRLITP
jgi:hypothetical protein